MPQVFSAVTAVTPSNRSVPRSFDWSVLSNPIVVLNLILISLCVSGFLYFIAGTNAVASSEYNISSERSAIAKLTEVQSSLTAKKSAMENPLAAAAFAQAQHMAEAKDIVYVFENNNVALQK